MTGLRLSATAPEEPSDEELVRGCQSGSSRAFDALYHRHVGRVYRLLTRLLGTTPERDDLLQQIFVKVYRGLAGFRGDASLSTFLYRITVNIAWDYLDHKRRAPVIVETELEMLVDDARAYDSDRTALKAELTLAFSALDRLKPQKRVAFVLVAVEGLSLKEAAEILGTNDQVVKQRVLSARKELKATVKRMGGHR